MTVPCRAASAVETCDCRAIEWHRRRCAWHRSRVGVSHSARSATMGSLRDARRAGR